MEKYAVFKYINAGMPSPALLYKDIKKAYEYFAIIVTHTVFKNAPTKSFVHENSYIFGKVREDWLNALYLLKKACRNTFAIRKYVDGSIDVFFSAKEKPFIFSLDIVEGFADNFMKKGE